MNMFFALALSVYFLDLISKFLIRKYLPLGADIRLLPVFSLTHVQNTGIAFGLLQGRNYIFLILGIIMVIVIGWLGIRLSRKNIWEGAGLGLILGGACGNITDRVIFGRVTDFLDFFIGPHHWPSFNVADSAICIGAGLMILGGFFKRKI